MLRTVNDGIRDKVMAQFDSLSAVRPAVRVYGELLTMIAANNDSSPDMDSNLAMFMRTLADILNAEHSLAAFCEKVLAACIVGTSLDVDTALSAIRGYICTYDISAIFGGNPLYDVLRDEYSGGMPDDGVIRQFVMRGDNRRALFNSILKFGLGFCTPADMKLYPALDTIVDIANKINAEVPGVPAESLVQPLVQYTFNTQDSVGFGGLNEDYAKSVRDALLSITDKASLVAALQQGGGAERIPALVDSVDRCITMNASGGAGGATGAGGGNGSGTGRGGYGPAAPTASSLGFDDAISMNLDPKTIELFMHMAHNEDQLREAMEHLGEARFPAMLSTYHPGFTEQEVTNILDNHTRMASHRPYRLSMGDPKEKKTILIPPAFKVDQFYAIWTRAVVGGLGFPFINFTCPTVMTLIRGSDPRQIKDAYRKLKAMFKQCGLKKPIDTLKEFAHATYRNCSLAALSVDAEELYNAAQGSTVSAGVVDTYSKVARTKGSVSLPLEFLTVFYTVLSPINAMRQYSELCGMTVQEYQDYLVAHGKPPVYILNPKKVLFKRGPKAGLLHQLFSSKVAPVLVRARVGSHEGGFMIPERIADAIFIE